MAGNRYGLAIRAADASDADVIAELMTVAGDSVDRHGLASRLGAINPASGAVLLATAWGPPSGVVAVTWSWRLDADLKVAELAYLLVDPEQRRNGIARLLLKAASQAARVAGCGELRLTCMSDRSSLEAFCLAAGFTHEGHNFLRRLRKFA